MAARQNLIVVSNRLPVSLKKDASGSWQSTMSSGGLVAALSGLGEKTFTWVGWVGCDISVEDRACVGDMLMENHACVPVYLDEKVADEHYNGFSNGVLWPLCHYMPGNMDYDEKLWHSYEQANKEFVDVVDKIYQPGDIVWIHDYHLMLFSKLFKERTPNAKMGFFLHIPFPSSEVFRVLPCRSEILLGVLNCDLIGFHTYDYARHFLKACTRILGLETAPNGVFFKDKFIPVGIFPVGIDPTKFTDMIQTKEVQARVSELTEKFKGQKVIVGVDRLDYIKGVPHKLNAIEELFRKYPQWQGKLVLIQVAVPSRQDVGDYQQLKRDVEEQVGRINGTYGTIGYSPIHYMFKSVNMVELSALYSIADAAIISSLRDGMNLVAQEYVLCQGEKKGVLILSEFAGAAGALSGSILINPWNAAEVADSIHVALTMPVEERTERLKTLTKYIKKHTAAYWGSSFVNELKKTTTVNESINNIPRLDYEEVVEAYRASQCRMLIFAYDGTLIPFSSSPSLCEPPTELLKHLQTLIKNSDNIVYILSGRDRHTISEWFSSIDIGLSAEYGFFTKAPGTKLWEQAMPDIDTTWKDSIRPLLKYFAARTPGSFIEEKEMHLTFHYRNADPAFGSFQARELHLHLDTLPVDIVVGEKTIGVRPHPVNPSGLIRRIISEMTPKGLDFLLIVGDTNLLNTHFNPKDLPNLDAGKVFTCAVGKKNSREKYYLSDNTEVVKLLNMLATEAPKPGRAAQ